MSFPCVTPSVVAIELPGKSFPEAPAPDRLRALVRQALQAEGLADWPEMELELFPGRDSFLLLARPCIRSAVCFAFSDFEDLLAAALSLVPPPESRLTYWETLWLLQLHCREQSLPSALWEFGCPVPAYSPVLGDFFAEQGQVLLSRDAAATLQKHFNVTEIP